MKLKLYQKDVKTTNEQTEETATKKTYAPLPDGLYNVCIEKFYKSTTRKGDGELLRIQFMVVDGQYAPRRVFQNILTNHPSKSAMAVNVRAAENLFKAFNIMAEDLEAGLTEAINKKSVSLVRVTIEDNPGFKPTNKVTFSV